MSKRPSHSRNASSSKAITTVSSAAASGQTPASPSASRRNSSASRRSSLNASGSIPNSVSPSTAATSAASFRPSTPRKDSDALRRMSAGGSSSSASSASATSAAASIASNTTSRRTSVSTGTSDSFDNYYPLLRVDDDKRLYCSNNGDNACFTPGDFGDSDKKILHNLFQSIGKITQCSPISRDPPKTNFLTEYQYVYRANGSPARLVKRSDKIGFRFRGLFYDYAIIGVWPNGRIECEYSIGFFNGQEQFRPTTFDLWQFTEVQSYRVLTKLARGAELRRDACYWDEAMRINKMAATKICDTYDFVRVQDGEVMLVPARGN